MQQGNYPLFLYDNNSTDGKLDELILDYKDRLNVIRSDTNYGFAKANNIIVKKMIELGYTHTLLLNNDTEFSNSRVLVTLYNAIKDNIDAGVIAPIVVNKRITGDEIVKNSSILIKILLAMRIIPKQRLYTTSNYKTLYTAHGCALLVNNEVFQRVKGFPEYNFMYGEENAFCRKICLNNYRIVQCLSSESVTYHNHELDYNDEPWRNYLCGRNLYLEIKLYHGCNKYKYAFLMKMYMVYCLLRRERGYEVFVQGMQDGKKIVKDRISDDEIRRLTIEYVKQNID